MTTTPAALVLAALDAPADAAVRAMTFPAYRHMLSLRPTPRHPEQGDRRIVEPVALLARVGGEPAGLALAEIPRDEPDGAELLSLYAKREHRRRGIGTALVAGIERLLAARGAARVRAIYMTGKEGTEAAERLLLRRGWSTPLTRTVTLRFTPEEAAATPWYGRVRLEPPDYEIFGWAELTDEERAALERSNETEPWIAKGLEPWRHDANGFDPVSSVGLRYRGRIVGWVVNHRIGPDLVRFTCSFLRKDLSRRGRIVALYTASIERLRESGCRLCTFVTPVAYPNMVRFVRRRCAPWASFFGETRETSKELAAGAS